MWVRLKPVAFHAISYHLYVRHTRGREIIISWEGPSQFIFPSIFQAVYNSWEFNCLVPLKTESCQWEIRTFKIVDCKWKSSSCFKRKNTFRLLNLKDLPITVNWWAVPWTLVYISWISVKMGLMRSDERVHYKFILWKSNAPMHAGGTARWR